MLTLFVILEILAFIGIILLALAVAKAMSEKPKNVSKIKIEHINSKCRKLKDRLITKMLTKEYGKKAIKESQKREKKENKEAKEEESKEISHNSRVFVLNFNGDAHASQVEDLRDEISAVINIANKDDQVLLRIDSPGGSVNGYGLVASQLQRLKDANITLVTAVDEMAASGGYMAAVVSDKIIAAPFSYIGSIGVVAEFPNFNNALKKFGVEYQSYTAGESKRSVGMFAPITKEGKKRLLADLIEIHEEFKKHIKQHRKNVDISKIGTGKVWLGMAALKAGLVDEIMTSDEYILNLIKSNKHVYEVKTDAPKPSLLDKISDAGIKMGVGVVQKLINLNTRKDKL